MEDTAHTQSLLESITNDEIESSGKEEKGIVSKENDTQEGIIGEITEESEDIIDEKKMLQRTVIRFYFPIFCN